MPAVALLLLLAGAGCMDEGFDGTLPVENILLDQWGCVAEEIQVFPFFVDFDVPRLDAVLEVTRGAADLILGVGEAPLNYFGLGRGPGTQQVLVGPESHVPLQAGTWSARVAGVAGVATDCDPERPTDWHLVVSRTAPDGGAKLLAESCRSADCAVPACTATPCAGGRVFTIPVPADAGSLEVVLNSLAGDADLMVWTGAGVWLGASANPGTGFDILRLGQDALVPLRGQDVTVQLASWAQVTDAYDLTVSYVPGGPAPAATE